MEGDSKVPPTLFCNPPHSEPPPYLLPLSSVTPSCEDGQTPDDRSSSGYIQKTPKKQEPKDSLAESRQNISPAKRESSMVQVSQSLSVKLMRVDTPCKQPIKKSGLDLNVASGCQMSKHKDMKGSKNQATPSSSTLTVDVNTAGKTEHDFNQSGMEADEEVGGVKSPGSPTSVKRWVIGPLFQSFKSKMACFTQIVMSPVRLFKPNGSPPEPDVDISSASHSSHQQGPGYELTSGTVQHFEAGRGGHDPASHKHLKFSMDVKTHGTSEEDKFSLEGKQNMMRPGDVQWDTCMSASSEKETNNNDSLPCMQRSPLLRSSMKCGSESTESQFNLSSSTSFQPPDSSSSSCGSKLSLIVQMEEQVDLTGARRRQLRRKCVCQSEAASQSSPSAATNASEANRISSLPAEVGICEPKAKRLATKSYVEYKISDCIDSETSSPSSSVYYTTSESLYQADDDSIKAVGLPQDRNNMLVCGSQSHMSIRKSPRKPLNVTVNETRNCASVSQCLQKQLDECEGKKGFMAGTAKEVRRRCRATPFTAIKRDAEKRKRVKLKTGERCEEAKKEDTVDVELGSCTLTSVEHASGVELVQTGVGTKPCTTSKSQSLKSRVLPRVSQSSTVHIETTQKPSETHVPLMEVMKDKGRRRCGRVKKNKSLTVMATSSNGSELEHSNGSLCDNSIAASNTKGMISALSYDDTDSSSACNLEMETTMITTLMKENHELPVSEQHLDIKVKWPQTASKNQQKYICKKRKSSTMVEVESSQNQQKCPELNEIGPPKPQKQNKSSRSCNSSSTQQLGKSLGLTDVDADPLHSLKPSIDDNVHVDSRSSDVTQQTLQTTAVVAVHKDASWGAEISGSDSCKSPKKTLNRSNKTSVGDALLVDKRFVETLGGRKRVRRGQSTVDNDKSSQSLHLNQITFDDKKRTVPWPVRTYPKCSIKLNKNIVKHSMAMQENYVARDSDVEEVFSTASEPTTLGQNKTADEVMEEEQGKEDECSELRVPSEMRLRGRGQRKKPKKAGNQSRTCRPVVRKRGQEEEEERNTVIGEQMDFSSDNNNTLTKHLIRSYSCPEIPALLHYDSHWTTPLHGRILSVPRLHPSLFPPVPPPPAPSRRPRRHTVSSVEIEREIAPLCLRKEVFPSRRSYTLGNTSYHLFPSAPLSTSSSAWASCFLSSPLAFLSRKLRKGSLAATSSACSHDTSSSPSSVFSSISPSCSSVRHLFSSSDPCDLPSDISSASVVSICSALSKIPLKSETSQQREEDVEDRNRFRNEFEAVGMREEKALSDSEIKHVERRKVSSIRIRKALPKPLHNLTPMGLPKPIRVKKKDFSLEEIYTNKNFTKPPERRLETIFEVPLSRRDGSQSLLGQKRMKRFVEFPEVGVARKPRKPLVGGGAGGGLPRKVVVGSPFGRPKRGGCPSKDHPTLNLKELDSLLCSKLDQLDSWLALDQKIC